MVIRSRSVLLAAVVSALVCGAAVALFKGDGRGTYAMAVGNISAPWLLPSLLIGYAVRNKAVAGLLGVGVTWLMLASFYVAYESQGLLGSAIYADVERYFVFGIVAGGACAVVASTFARPAWLVSLGALLLFCEGWAWTHTPEAIAQRFDLPSLGPGARGSHHHDAWNAVFWGERLVALALVAAVVLGSRRSTATD